MYTYNRRREIIKNTIFITIILLLAVVSTYYIYAKFQVNQTVDYNSKSLDVTYHEKSGNKLTIGKVTPVTDSVGLSSKSYNIVLKNNLTETVDFKIKVLDDLETIVEDECSDNLITKDSIRISIKNGNKENKIYNLDELEDGILLADELDALETKNLSIRVWVKQDSVLPLGSNMHYHGLVQVEEVDGVVAINK